MLDKQRIEEAESNVRSYLKEGLLKEEKPEQQALKILINNCKESLKVAEIIFDNNYSNLWSIVCSYYSMYYIAKAVLYILGYKVGQKISHKVTADSLIMYVRGKLKDSLIEEYEEAKEEALEISDIKTDELISSFDFERVKRSRFQYSMTETAMQSKAKTSFERAKIFVFELEKLIQT